MDFKEKKLSSNTIFRGVVFNISVDEVELPDGKLTKREVVHHHGGVCIAAKTSDNRYYLVTQFRYPHKQLFLEFPAGKKEKNEDSLECAKRELQEETGYRANNWLYLGACVPTPAYDTEVLDLYYADELIFTGQNLDAEEFLSVQTYSLAELETMVLQQKITDSKTICLLYHLKTRAL